MAFTFFSALLSADMHNALHSFATGIAGFKPGMTSWSFIFLLGMIRFNESSGVLMLGWEFPPAITGGLGIACHDLSAALSRHVPLTLIIPRSDKSTKMKNIRLLGLNNLSREEVGALASMTGYEDVAAEIHYISANLNPYASIQASRTEAGIIASALSAESLDIDELYGPRMLENVVRYAQQVVALSQNLEYELIHTHDWMTLLAGMEIKQRTGKPLVAHIHALEYDRVGPESRGAIYQIEKKGMEMADLVIAVSNYTANIIHVHYGIPREKIIAVHNGIRDTNAFRSAKPFDEKLVLFVGRLTRQKAPERFREIAQKVLRHNPGVRFVIAGTGDSFGSTVWSSAYNYLGNRFHFTGFLREAELQRLLSMSDAYCMPSLSEPFGLSALEAAQFDVPCVLSKQSGVSEVLHGSLTFDHWDTDKAAHFILRLLEDESFKNSIVSDAREDLKQLSWDRAAEKVLAAYHKLPVLQQAV